jgi:molybdopterin molybdotransferase
MIELEAALERVLSTLPSPVSEQVPLSDSLDRIAAAPVAAPISLPCFDNSAMDGYALRSTDTGTATPENPVGLAKVGQVPAGAIFSGPALESGQCIRIFTGSPLPEGADAVIMQEDTRADGETILCLDTVKPWENVRLAGEDLKRGTELVASGDRLTAGRIAVMAAFGIPTLAVGRRPKVGLVATGDELREPGATLKPGEIYESNRRALAQFVVRAGGLPVEYPLVNDRLDATTSALRRAFDECDIVATSGGVSVGEHDHVKAAFEALGGSLDFWKVRIKPGKPFVFGRVREKLLLGLPGNPISALVTFLLLARPAILRFQGATETALERAPGVLTEDLRNHGDRRHFMRVHLDGSGQVRSAGMQASHALGALLDANALLDLPPNCALHAGDPVSVLRID